MSDEFLQSGEFPSSPPLIRADKTVAADKTSPVPVASDAVANLTTAANSTDKADNDDLRLSQIHDILVNRGLHSSGSISEPSRSRHSRYELVFSSTFHQNQGLLDF